VGRRLGQHFLTDPSILDRIVEAIDPHPTDIVLEIGPGRGSLTERLTPKVARVIGIEKDRELGSVLGAASARTVGEHGNVSVVVGDALRTDWHAELSRTGPATPFPPMTFKVVGNIPYYITSPLIDKALTPPLPERIVFLVQREVADRLAAAPGTKTYGALTVGVQAAATVERLFVVRAGAFHPPPAVDSAVVRITPREHPLVPHEHRQAFRIFVQQVFSQRRKQLGGILRHATGRDALTVDAALEALGVDATARPERLAPSAFAQLYEWSRV
jgi:16S rRNA (adenine1518-N6/adenine1519-N6)-dimethyltransferase